MPRKKDWIEIVLHVAFWVGVFYTLLSLTVSHVKVRIDHNGSIMERDVQHTLSPRIFLMLGFLVLLFYGNIFWLFKKALRYKNIFIRVAIPLAWFIAIFTANYYVEQLLPAQRIPDQLMQTLRLDQTKAAPKPPIIKDNLVLVQNRAFAFGGDGLSNTISFVFVIVFGLSVAYFFLKEWARTEKMRSQLEAAQLDTEVKFLKSQVNPHFLFNTLNNLFSLAQKKGNDDLADGISKLSGMMRYMIYESNEEKVPLKKEIEYLEDCILLNKLRYADNEALVGFNYSSQTEGVVIAPMLFIPFVENAFKHGIAIGKRSHIDISIFADDDELIFICVNDDHKHVKKMEDENGGIGLDNVKRRLDLVYPGKYQLQITNPDNQYRVELKVNLQ